MNDSYGLLANNHTLNKKLDSEIESEKEESQSQSTQVVILLFEYSLTFH